MPAQPDFGHRAELNFDQLRSERQRLVDAVLVHRTSVERFQHPDRSWFLMSPAETPEDKEVGHLSSSATCLESLHDAQDYVDDVGLALDEQRGRVASLTANFAEAALRADQDRWQSDEAARVYCRVRTLTPLLALAPRTTLDRHAEAIEKHIRFVWDRVDVKARHRQGITEAPEKVEEEHVEERATYPPNAFHTFWAIRMLDEAARHEGLAPYVDEFATRRAVAELWCRQTLAAQTALIRARAEHVDAHQLAWALSLELRHTPIRSITPGSPRVELYESALEAFFDVQLDSGGWPSSEPLFHYPAAGNAYCYTFETLTELLRPALSERHGAIARQLLRPYLSNLLRASHFALQTATETAPGALGWSSGHHPQRTQPEAWATAEVFSFLQALRRLVGRWTAEEAAAALKARRPRASTPTEAEKLLRTRGDTWTQPNEATVGRRLASLFLHPLQALLQEHDDLDPDRPLIAARDDLDQARAAILFGPPGGSKTTLVEALAGVIDWQYVEIHAADFLSEGMDFVPARADRIFAQLMELDRCVVLFDEIDELIRERQGAESDPFGRFLTTSMLPKLAKLWEQRRILYFVATNDIDAADPAIKRSQRFDAAIFVPPPSFAVKRAQLERSLGHLPDAVATALTYERVSDALTHEWGQMGAYGVFALLRYDQIPELAERLRSQLEGSVDTALRDILWDMGRGLQGLEWRKERHRDKADGATDEPTDPFALYKHFRDAERRDARMLQLLTLNPVPHILPVGCVALTEGSRYIRVLRSLEEVARTGPQARWELTMDNGVAVDNGLLDFRMAPVASDPSRTPPVVDGAREE